MSQHSNTVVRIDRFTNFLIQLAVEADELFKQANDVGLSAAGSAEKYAAITEAGRNYGLEGDAAATLTSAITLVDAIGALTHNRPVTQADWLSTMNKVNVGGGRVPKLEF